VAGAFNAPKTYSWIQGEKACSNETV